MGCIRPATPGFIVTLIATVLLAIVSFCVPYFKSVFFLKANIDVGDVKGSITFGTLGYCLELSNGTICSKPSIGYELDINGLVGNKLPVEIPQVVVKWITYALVLHIVALGLSAGSAVFGLLAHVREMSMTCCSTCISGFAAAVALIAFIFDIVLFFLAKARINAVGSAQIGSAIWLTLIAWVLLFFSGCFFTLGRCCISNRPGGGSKWRGDRDFSSPRVGYAEQMRLDAVKAEADRKARQKASEVGLPAFAETQPLTGRLDGDHVYVDDPYNDQTPNHSLGRSTHNNTGGYVQAAPGTRAVDEYYNPTTPNNNLAAATYPPHTQQNYPPQRQGSETSNYGQSYAQNLPGQFSPNQLPPQGPQDGYFPAAATSSYGYNPHTTSPPPVSTPTPHDPYADYSHAYGGAAYQTTPLHQQQTSGHSQYNQQYDQPVQYGEAYLPDAYNNGNYPASSAMPSATSYSPSANPYVTQPVAQQYGQHDRSYTSGSNGYGSNSVPPLSTDLAYTPAPQTSPIKGPRSQPVVLSPPQDSPPGYDPGLSNVPNNYNYGKR